MLRSKSRRTSFDCDHATPATLCGTTVLGKPQSLAPPTNALLFQGLGTSRRRVERSDFHDQRSVSAPRNGSTEPWFWNCEPPDCWATPKNTGTPTVITYTAGLSIALHWQPPTSSSHRHTSRIQPIGQCSTNVPFCVQIRKQQRLGKLFRVTCGGSPW